MSPTCERAGRRRVVVTLAASATVLLGAGTAQAAVTAVHGEAFGYSTHLSFFGAPAETAGPEPSVALAPDAGNSPQSASLVSATAHHGPFTFFSSDALSVGTSGALGPGGFATSSSEIENINRSEEEAFTAVRAASSCTATEGGVAGSTTITDGRLRLSDGDPDVPGDETVVTIPANPAPNTTFEGEIEPGHRFRYTFNEQVVSPDGSLTVYAAHQRFTGPSVVGDVYIGKSECGVASVDVTGPSVTVDQAVGQADPTSTSPIRFAVAFSEPVTGFDAGDISFAGSSAGGVLGAAVTGGPSNFDLAVTGMTTTGTVVASIPAGAAIDSADNASSASTSTDNAVTWVAPDGTAPAMTCSASPSRIVPGANNHKLTDVEVAITVDDGDSGAAGFVLLSVTSSQADSGLGDEDQPGDVQGWSVGTPDTSGRLRTERYRTARVYTLTYEGSDAAGNTATCATTVTVPKGA